jgi:hypothetical protein
LIALIAGGCALAGCQQSDSTLQPIAATAVPMTETFSGTVAVGQSDSRNFVVQVSGAATFTLTSLANAQSSTIAAELSVGQPTTTTCSALTGGVINTGAGAAAQLSGTLIAGTYCVQVRDFQNIGPLTYSVTVVHP